MDVPLKLQILDLRNKGFTYNQIQSQLKCSKGTIAFHCGSGQKEKYAQRRNTYRKLYQGDVKLQRFKRKTHQMPKTRTPDTNGRKRHNYYKVKNFHRRRDPGHVPFTFTFENVKEKYPDQKCYLTGRPINYDDPTTYNFDHIHPAAKNGTNTLDNLGVTCPEANHAKTDLTLSEFIILCRDVLLNFGCPIPHDWKPS